ncbi:hypothetical protein, partial [Streptomyces sp. NPDC001274]
EMAREWMTGGTTAVNGTEIEGLDGVRRAPAAVGVDRTTDRHRTAPLREHGADPVFTRAGGVFTTPLGQASGSVDRCGSRLVESGGSRVDDESVSTLSTPVDWRLLASLAHAHHTAARTPRTPVRTLLAASRTVTRTGTSTPELLGSDLPVRPARTVTRTATSRRSGDGRTTA